MKIRDVVYLFATVVWIILGPGFAMFELIPDSGLWHHLILSGVAMAGLYTGFDIVIATQTSLGYRATKLLSPFSIYNPPIARLGGLLWIVINLGIAWTAISSLLHLVR